MDLRTILNNLPEVIKPTEKKLSFNVKLKWTLIVLVAFFVLANISLYGLEENALSRFEYLAIILGTDFGSIISLGIGPIVMASIILQLLVGSKIINIDTSTPEGKKFFQGIQKLLVFFFILFEATVYVLMKGLAPNPSLGGVYGPFILIVQLILGGLMVVLMDDLVSKWGFGSGVSLFIAAGVGWRLITNTFQFLGPERTIQFTGKIPELISAIIAGSDFQAILLPLAAIVFTVLVFLIVVWAQSLKIEVPLSYDRLRGYSVKWPLSFFYASVIPVILTAALMANLQLLGRLVQQWLNHPTFLGNFVGGKAISGLSFWLDSTNLVSAIITQSWSWTMLIQAAVHLLVFIVFSAVFSVFWVKTSGMDAQSQAHNIISSGLQIPGFRKDERILETVLKRYVLPLTVMGGVAIGILAALANLLGTIVSGTALLLGIMIIFQFYQNIAQQHSMDMNPALRKFIG